MSTLLVRLMFFTYVVDACVLELVLVFIVEHDAVLIQETHDGRLPPRTAQEVYDDVKEPVL